ncbi:cyclic lactone autoinducer peptide [Paenibacillus sp. FSL L8-0470]
MLKKANVRIVSGLATCLSMVAIFIANTNSALYVHQPEVPEELLK